MRGVMGEKWQGILEALFFIGIGFLISCRNLIKKILDRFK